MKTLLIASCILLFTAAHAQDTLYLHSGEVICGKVDEIGKTEIRYRKAVNLEGPMYVVDKDDVALIQFRNGTKEVFGEDDEDDHSGGSRATVINNYGGYWGRPGVNLLINPFPLFAYSYWPRVYRGGYYFRHGWSGHHGWNGHHGWSGHHGAHYGRRH